MHSASLFAALEFSFFVIPYEVEAMLRALSSELKTFLDSSDYSYLQWARLGDFKFRDV